jgi:hypothetical protein
VIPPFTVFGPDADCRTPAPLFGNDAASLWISKYRTEFTASYQINPEKAKAAQRRWLNYQGVEKQASGRQPRQI